MTISTFGAIAGMAGLEHGVGEVLQGDKAPDGVMIASWAGSELFEVVQGEPAMTLAPNLLVAGILTLLSALVFLLWVTVCIERNHGGLVLMALSIVLLLVGGGFAPPLLGVILGFAATRMSAAPAPRERSARGQGQALSKVWPWSFGAGVVALLSLFPGTIIVVALFGRGSAIDSAVPALSLAMLGLLVLSLFAAFARDSERRTLFHPAAAMRSSSPR